MKNDGEHKVMGIGVAPGVAIGPAFIIEQSGVPVPEYEIPSAQVEKELKRLHGAIAKVQKQTGHGRFIGIVDGNTDDLLHQLHRASTIAIGGRNKLTAPSMRSALKLAGNQKTTVIDSLTVLLCRPGQQTPVLRMSFNRRFDQFVEFRFPPEILQTLDRFGQIARDLIARRPGIQCQLTKPFVRVLKVSRFELFLDSRSIHSPSCFFGLQVPSHRTKKCDTETNSQFPHDVNPFLALRGNQVIPPDGMSIRHVTPDFTVASRTVADLTVVDLTVTSVACYGSVSGRKTVNRPTSGRNEQT